jgi:hypothetical protein
MRHQHIQFVKNLRHKKQVLEAPELGGSTFLVHITKVILCYTISKPMNFKNTI